MKFFLIFFLFYITQHASSKDIKIIFGSCSNQNKSMQHWEFISTYKPDYLMLLGDNVYGDFNTSKAKKLKNAYSKLNNNKYFSDLKIKAVILPVWDDHDYGTNDGSKNWIYKEQAKDVFLDFFNVKSNDQRRLRDGIYFSRNLDSITKIKVIGLDTRYFKDEFKLNLNKNINKKYIIDNNTNKTILGKTQWDWLESQINNEYDVLIILSSIQVLATKHGWEKWYNFPHERKKFLDLISRKKKLTIILSGDRHIGGIYKYNDKIYEVTSSSFNQKTFSTKENDDLSLEEIVTVNNFGFMKINNKKKNISIELVDGFYKKRKIFRKLKLNF